MMTITEDCRRHPITTIGAIVGLALSIISVVGGGIWIGTTNVRVDRNSEDNARDARDIASLRDRISLLQTEASGRYERLEAIGRDVADIRTSLKRIDERLMQMYDPYYPPPQPPQRRPIMGHEYPAGNNIRGISLTPPVQ